MSDPYVICLTFAGWLATTWLAYRWGLHSQKLQREHAAQSAVKDRRRDFLVFMQTWRVDFNRPRYGHGSDEEPIRAFIHGIVPLRGYVALIRGDFTEKSRVRFDELVATVPQTYIHDDKKLLKTMDDVIEYVESAT
jgi:hypothetical protein